MADTNKKTQNELIKEYADKLEQGIQDIFTSGRYEEYLRTMSRFHRYSMRNTALIFMQYPDAKRVAGFNKWRDEFERFPRKGEKSIKIFAPSSFTVQKEMDKLDENGNPELDENGQPVKEIVDVKIPSFKVVSVFDVGQTYGKPIPELSESLTGEVQHYDLLRQALEETAPYPVVYERMDESIDGFMDMENPGIHIREGMSQPQTILAHIHERSHGELHKTAPENETPDERRARRNREEVEAESISYTVCQYFGIETGANSFGYIAGWSKDKELSELKASLETIKQTASRMIDSIETRFNQLKKEHGIEQTVVEAEAVQVTPNEQEARAPEKQYELDYGHMGNGLTVWNRLEERDGDYVTVAHIAPDRTVTYYDPDMPEDVRAQIERTAQTVDMTVSATQDAPVFTAPPQNENPNTRLTELQQKGMEIARRYESLPLQDRLNIIAKTFGCKTASIKTIPCTGSKWRGTSDVSIVLDNGTSLFVGNYRTPQAKTAKVQNECVNGALASYNPEIVSETKERSRAALLKLEAQDNAIAAQKGLKPYTFLNVELCDGSDEASGGHIGWYYVTLAVDGKIIAHIESGLNYNIARGILRESRPNYFPAGALKDHDVDFVFNNVGFASSKDLYTFPLNENARERAEIRLTERQNAAAEQDTPETLARDYNALMEEFDPYGYRNELEIGGISMIAPIFEFEAVLKQVAEDAQIIAVGVACLTI